MQMDPRSLLDSKMEESESGKSEYRIEKSNCTLKKLREKK